MPLSPGSEFRSSSGLMYYSPLSSPPPQKLEEVYGTTPRIEMDDPRPAPCESEKGGGGNF